MVLASPLSNVRQRLRLAVRLDAMDALERRMVVQVYNWILGSLVVADVAVWLGFIAQIGGSV